MLTRSPLRLALIANPNLPIPPYYGYGGTQRGVYDFLTEFDRRGHYVTLYAPLSSRVGHLSHVELRGTVKTGLWEPGNAYTPEERRTLNAEYIAYVVQDIARGAYDFVNVRSDSPVLVRRLVQAGLKERILYSLHNVSGMATMEPVLEQRVHCVAHCHSHKADYGELDTIHVVLYGIPTEEYPYSPVTLSQTSEVPALPVLRTLQERGQDYLLLLSCIRPEKGQKSAIAMARAAGLPLIIAGAPERRSSDEFVRYHEEHVLPEVDNRTVFYFGSADEETKKELFRLAKGFLFPSGLENPAWREPFGRAPVEAMACGTPVVAYDHGSLPELIRHGEDGFLFRTFDEAVDQLRRLDEIPRAVAHRAATTRFDKARVAAEYEALLYDRLALLQPVRAVAGLADEPAAHVG